MDGYKWKDIFSVGLPGLYFVVLTILCYCLVFQVSLLSNNNDSYPQIYDTIFSIILPFAIVLIGSLLNFVSSALEKSLKLGGSLAKQIFRDRSLHHLTDEAMELLKKKANLDCCNLKDEQQMTSARHYVAEAMILLANRDVLDEYYVRKVICRNFFLSHLLIVVMMIVCVIWFCVESGFNAFYCPNTIMLALFLIYCIVGAYLFYQLWCRFTKRYIQIQLFCFQTLVDSHKIS